jgi:hypothetical protein
MYCRWGWPIGDERLGLLSELAAAGSMRIGGVLVEGEALPLWRDCPCAEPCWAEFPQEWQPGPDPNDPWVGISLSENCRGRPTIACRPSSPRRCRANDVWQAIELIGEIHETVGGARSPGRG